MTNENSVGPAPQHKDAGGVGALAAAMKDKLAKKRGDGRGGWETCSAEMLSAMLREHVEKGDPIDVANFCMMLFANGDKIAATPAQGDAEPLVWLYEFNDRGHWIYRVTRPDPRKWPNTRRHVPLGPITPNSDDARDAGRYRYLRNKTFEAGGARHLYDDDLCLRRGQELDDAIDNDAACARQAAAKGAV